MRLRGLVTICVGMWFTMGGLAQAVSLTIKITNTTVAHPLRELLIVAHAVNHPLFVSGNAAPDGLEELAECGKQGALAAEMLSDDPKADVWGVNSYRAGVVSYPKLLELGVDNDNLVSLPGLVVTNGANTRLSIVGRIMLTNDGFAGLEAALIPLEPGTYTFYMLAYDAGTEANNELLIPDPDLRQTPPACVNDPYMAETKGDVTDDYLGDNGIGASGQEGSNPFITIHRGVLGDTTRDGGKSDLDYIHHRWHGAEPAPSSAVATVKVTVQ